jgi:hypothetical protein
MVGMEPTRGTLTPKRRAAQADGPSHFLGGLADCAITIRSVYTFAATVI